MAGLTLTGVEELYITLDDVQTRRENFLQLVSLFGNTRGISVLKFSSDIKLHGSDRLSGFKIWPVGCFCGGMQRPLFYVVIRKIAAMFSSLYQTAPRRNGRLATWVRNLAIVATLLLYSQSSLLAAEKSNAAKSNAAKHPAAPCAPLIDAWLISSRGLGCTNGAFPATGPALHYWQRVDNQGPWLPRTHADFLVASQEIRTTWISIHGNRVDSQEAVSYGSQVTNSLVPGHKSGLPLRTITWSWPSDQIHGLAADVRTKAARTPSESFYLGWLVNQMPAPTPVVFIGHSFGARIGTGTMHLLAGGALQGCGLAGYDPARQLSRGIFTASAIHNNWLLPNAPHGRALDQAESILFINNSCDPALKRYRFIDRSRPEAIGYCGAMVDAARRHKVKQLDACGSVGKTHDANIFMRAGSLIGSMRMFLPLNWTQPLPIPLGSKTPNPFRGLADQVVLASAEAVVSKHSFVEQTVSFVAGDE